MGQKVLKNCADKLKCSLPKAVRSMGIAYHDYAEVVSSICQDTPGRDLTVSVLHIAIPDWLLHLIIECDVLTVLDPNILLS